MASWLLTVFVLSCVLSSGYLQRTYMRSCDCEYTEDGKCAYTLLLPASSSGDAAQCEAAGDLSGLEGRLATAESTAGEHGTAIVRLSNQIEGLKDLVEDNSCESCKECDPCQMMQQIDNIEAQNTDVASQIDQLDEDVSQIQDTIGIFRDGLEEQVSQIQKQCDCCASKGAIVSGTVASIPDSGITASSALNDTYTAKYSRILRTVSADEPGAWCPVEPNGEEYLEFNLGSTSRLYGIVTKGRSDYQQWVTSFSVQFKANSESSWMDFGNVLGEREVFDGNTDQNTAKVNMFWQPISAQYIRVFPLSAYLDRNKCMRADVIGCLDDFQR